MRTGTARRPRRITSFGSIRALPSGRFQVRYAHDARELKAPHTFETFADADEWLALRYAELHSGAEILAKPARQRSQITFRAYAETWLRDRELKPRTRALYRAQLDDHLLPAFGPRTLAGITAADVEPWFRSLDPGKPTQRAHLYSLLHSILASAVREEPPIIDVNPARIRGGGKVRRARRIEPATPEEIDVIVANIPVRFRAAVLLSAWAGLRYGEVFELRRKDLDMRNGVVHVTRGVVRLAGDPLEDEGTPTGPRYEVGTPKSAAGIRVVPLIPAIRPAIQAHLDRMDDKSANALLFTAVRSGGHVASGTLSTYWYPAREAAGRPDLRWHDLRHTALTYLAQEGATTAELMAWAGHSTPTAALIYQHTASGRLEALARKLSERVSPTPTASQGSQSGWEPAK